MALTAISLLCFAALLSFPGLGKSDQTGERGPLLVKVEVTNKYTNQTASYSTTVPKGMSMFGVLNKLKDTKETNFNFTTSINKNYDIYLESVNGLAGSTANNTSWELLSKKRKSVRKLDVGIVCYQPKPNEIFILNFTRSD